MAVPTRMREFAEEIRDAHVALDGEVVVDASALVVACELPKRWKQLRAAFTSVAVDAATSYECLNSCAEVRRVPGPMAMLAFGALQQKPQYLTIPDTDSAILMTRANALERQLGEVDSFETIITTPTEVDHPWLTVIKHCMERGASLWCDDVALRGIARNAGCPTFGTVALLHALDESNLLEGDIRDDVLQLARAGVADFILEPEDLVYLACDHGGYPGPAAAMLQQPAHWRILPQAIEAFLSVLDLVGPRPNEATAAWMHAAGHGLMANLEGTQLRFALRAFACAIAEHQTSSDTERVLLLQIADGLADAEQERREVVATAAASLEDPQPSA
ncbi:hypothetical protein [Streptacidiphilus sp. PAMC 29251]